MGNEQRPTDSRHADTPLFDPRHSPVFQRGYDPDADVAPVPSSSTRRPSGRLVSGRERAADQEQAAEPQVVPIPAPAQPPVDPTEEWTGDRRVRNPFIVALWIIGVGLIVVGVAFQWWALSRSNSYVGNTSEMPIEFVLQQLSWSISTPMISTGLLTIVGLVVLYAVRWQPPRERPVEPQE